VFLLLAPLVSAVSIEGYVNDYANILSSESSEIESILKSLHTQGSAEFAIVTINSLEGRDIDGYAFELAEGKLGDKEKNNGLLLLVSLEDRKYRFEVGRGLEPVLPDIIVGRIGRIFLFLLSGKAIMAGEFWTLLKLLKPVFPIILPRSIMFQMLFLSIRRLLFLSCCFCLLFLL